MKGPLFNYYITIADVRLFLSQKKRWLGAVFIVSFFAGLALFALRAPSYRAVASFQDAGVSGTSDQIGALKKMVEDSTSNYRKGKAIVWMKSTPVLSRVIEREGLQIELKSPTIFTRYALTVPAHLRTKGFRLKEGFVNQIKGVVYEGEEPLDMELTLASPSEMIVRMGQVEKAFPLPGSITMNGISFRCDEVISHQEVGLTIALRVLPFNRALQRLKKSLHMDMGKADRNAIQIAYTHSSRLKAEQTLDTLMAEYQDFLIEDLNRVTAARMDYLTQRQGDLFDQFEGAMDGHVGHFQQNIRRHGFMTTSDWIEQKGALDIQLQERLQMIENEIEGARWAEKSHMLLPGPENQRLYDKLSELKVKKEAIEPHLKGQGDPFDDSLDVASCEQLLEGYRREMDTSFQRLAMLRSLSDQVLESAFELSSLSTFLPDPISQGVIKKGAVLTNLLRDPRQLGEKELKRASEQLVIHRETLKSHIEQLAELEEKRQLDLDRGRNSALLSYSAALSKEIELLEGQNDEVVAEHIQLLASEQELLLNRRHQLKEEMEDIPPQWMSETLLKLKSDLNYATLESLSLLVESTNVKHHLMQAESRPIDRAMAMNRPTGLPPIFSALLLALFAFLVAGTVMLVRQMMSGFPIAEGTLKKLGGQVCGQLPPSGHFIDESLVARRIVHSIGEEKLIGFFQSFQSPFARELASFYATHRSEKVLLISGEKLEGPNLPYEHQRFEGGLLDLFSQGQLKEFRRLCESG